MASSRVLLLLACDTHPRPGNGLETRRRDAVPAVPADAVGADFHPLKRLLNRLEDLGVGLLQLEGDVHLVVAAGLIGQIALTAVDVHRLGKRTGARRIRENFRPLLEKHVFQPLQRRVVQSFFGHSTVAISVAAPARDSTRSAPSAAAIHSLRKVASGFLTRTSVLERMPTRVTARPVPMMPAATSGHDSRHSISKRYRASPHDRTTPPIVPRRPARPPSSPYSTASIRATIRVLAPSVR